MRSLRSFVVALLMMAQPLALLAQLETTMSEAFGAFEQTGAAAGIWQNGAWIHQQALGYRNMDEKTPIDVHTTFQVASLSKAFTAAGVGILVDRGLVQWDDPVVEHLPWFRLYDACATTDFKVKDLLCHRNGYNTFDGDLLWYDTRYSAKEILQRFAKLPPKHGIREKYGYSNLMFIAAALLIEEATGDTWEHFIQNALMHPLEMTESLTGYGDFLEMENKAQPHVNKRPDAFRHYNNAKGAVGVKTSVNDLGKWAGMWLGHGVVNGDTILQPETVNYILNAHTARQVSEKNKEAGIHFQAAGLGWFVQNTLGTTIYRHSGGLPGLILNLVLVPEKNAAIVVLTNDETLFPFALTNEWLEYLMNDDREDWVEKYAPLMEGRLDRNRIALPEVKKSDTPVLTDRDLAGKYEDAYYGSARIYKEGGEMTLALLPTKSFRSGLKWLGKLNYRIRFEDPFLPDGIVTFELDAKGGVTGFRIDLPNPDFHFYNLHFKKK